MCVNRDEELSIFMSFLEMFPLLTMGTETQHQSVNDDGKFGCAIQCEKEIA